ncbi:hypothetical protein MMC28_005000 [Mycoblastus sanguinarius]|nr:hypothetical protein [Mycoblastus sanguinarius]
MPATSSPIIPIVALGVYRHVATKIDPLFAPTPYRMVAILDLTSERTAFRYTPYNLGVVLHTLHPRPKVLITGAAITAEMTAESVEVWEDYVREMGEAEGLVINEEGDADRRGVLVVRGTAGGWGLDGGDYAEAGWEVCEIPVA